MDLVDFAHQADHLTDRLNAPAWGLFWEQGTGKSRPTILTAAHHFLEGNIDALLVVAPNGVHLNWITDELPKHLPERVRGVMLGLVWRTASAGTIRHRKAFAELLAHPGFAVLTVPIESFITAHCKKAVWDFLRKRKALYVMDEGITIKSPEAKRTKAIVASARYAKMRRLLNGTPTAGEPWDVYPQMKFLDDDFWKPYELDGVQVFRSHFGRWAEIKDKQTGRKKFDLCVGYRRLDELKTILETMSDRVTKDDVLDLPPKLYSKARFELSTEQQCHYDRLKDEFITWLDTQDTCEGCGGSGLLTTEVANESYSYGCEACAGSGLRKGNLIVADLAITRLLRLQQVCNGFLPTPPGTEEPYVLLKDNPRIERFLAGALNLSHGCIVWVRFQKDAELVCEALRAHKRTVVRYDGTVSEDDRAEAKKAFQEGRVQFFVGNPAAISMGVTLIPGRTMVYYSSGFNLVHRLQSEDRSHRIGQTSSVHIVDVVADGTIDEHIVNSLRDKLDVSRQLTGDKLRAWL